MQCWVNVAPAALEVKQKIYENAIPTFFSTF